MDQLTSPQDQACNFASERPLSLFVADDDKDARTLLEIVLGGNDYHLTFFEDGEAIYQACQTALPDIAILDVQMPGRTGIQVCEEIKRLSGNNFVPVILLTSQSELVDKVNGLNCGADDYITKPFSFPELEARVSALLRVKVLTDQLKKTQGLLAQKERELIAMSVAGAAAHELGQPLTTLVLNAQLLKSLDPSNPKFEATLKGVLEQCQRMRTILNQLNELQEYKTKSYPGDLEILDIGSS